MAELPKHIVELALKAKEAREWRSKCWANRDELRVRERTETFSPHLRYEALWMCAAAEGDYDGAWAELVGALRLWVAEP